MNDHDVARTVAAAQLTRAGSNSARFHTIGVGVVLTLLLLTSGSCGLRHPGGSAPSGPVASAPEWAGGCEENALASLSVNPNHLLIEGSKSQTFAATALNACGTPVTNQSNVSWTLSASDLGSLSSGFGPTVVYSSCLAPMSGSMRVAAQLGGTLLVENVSLTIWFNESAGSSGSGIPTGNSSFAHSTALGLAIASAFVLGGVLVAVRACRSTRPPPK